MQIRAIFRRIAVKLSQTDQQLLALLRENARTSTAQLARRLGVSRTTIQSRIERLEREGVISGYTVRVDDAHEHGQIRAHIGIAVHPKQMTGVAADKEAIRPLPRPQDRRDSLGTKNQRQLLARRPQQLRLPLARARRRPAGKIHRGAGVAGRSGQRQVLPGHSLRALSADINISKQERQLLAGV